MNRSIIATVSATIGLLAGATGTAAADHSLSTHWGRSSTPFTLTLVGNVDAAWAPALDHASTVWSASEVLDTTVTPGASDPLACASTDGVVEVCNADYGESGWVGVARTWSRKGHTTAVTVQLNDWYVTAERYPDVPAKRRALACHEIGHALGLDHQDTDFDNEPIGTCLDYVRADGVEVSQNPDAHDYDQLASIYGHGDRRGTIASGGDGGDGGGSPGKGNGKKNREAADARRNPKADPAWGREMHSSPDGSHSVFVREQGDATVVTHVTWAG